MKEVNRQTLITCLQKLVDEWKADEAEHECAKDREECGYYIGEINSLLAVCHYFLIKVGDGEHFEVNTGQEKEARSNDK